MKTLIKNGTIASASDSFVGDLLIEGEKVSLVGVGLDKVVGAVDRTIDATGKYVLPGGIDPHTHLDMPFGGTVSADDFESRHQSGGLRRHHLRGGLRDSAPGRLAQAGHGRSGTRRRRARPAPTTRST